MENKRKVICCKTREEFNKVLEIFEKKGWKWYSGDKPTNLLEEYWCDDRDIYVEYSDRFSRSYDITDYTRCIILSFNEFLKEESRNIVIKTNKIDMKNNNIKQEFENLKVELLKKLNEFDYKINKKSETAHQYQLGEWLYCSWKGDNVNKVLFKFKKFENNHYHYSELYQIKDGDVIDDQYDHVLENDDYFGSIVKATPKQVEEFLIIVAKHKGFKVGTRFKNIDGHDFINTIGEYSDFDYYDYYYSKNVLRTKVPQSEWEDSCSNPAIYLNGKWAEIVKEPEIIIEGYKAIYDKENDRVKIGCKEFSLGDFKAMIQLMNLNKEYNGNIIISNEQIVISEYQNQKLTRKNIDELMKLFK